MTEDVGALLQKGLSEWWNEETEYVFQRIERWAAYARGYNRLRSQRLSRGRMTMQGGQEPRWSVSSNKLIIDDVSWSPRFHTFKKSRRKSRPEEAKINCCGTFNYQSNSNLDSTCLETYRYDHSIYFKTIGDIRNSKKDNVDPKNEREDRISISSEELVEWDVSSVSDFIANQLLEDGLTSDNIQSIFGDKTSPVQDVDGVDTVTWSNVDLMKINLNGDDTLRDEENNESKFTVAEIEEERNNNYIGNVKFVDSYLENRQTQAKRVSDGNVDVGEPQDHDETFRDGRGNRRSPKGVQPSIMSDNDVTWPSILTNYTKNVDSASA
ncbi:uncharacterized protein LOC128888256 [Hylaeus anthracinus]|uniref:uncharacterized protein LOC128888256 n=1 Tax=Hylaeus anthracinus TaxID=313031 RepID=UPI0023B9C007|nr:uncharacterized protein LOC128888256 [Hylaeus anthracinus]